MPYPIDNQLVVAVASSALFDLSESDRIFRESGEDLYREFQSANKTKLLERGVAFPFVRPLLGINQIYPDQLPIKVILLSRNDPETGLRVFDSIARYQLDISCAAFLKGKSPYEYIPAFNVSLFLSANKDDVKNAIRSGYPAGVVLPTTFNDDENDKELRIAFDFDGVIADDESETVFHQSADLASFQDYEANRVDIPHNSGPLAALFQKLGLFQELERKRAGREHAYQRILRTAIITARGAPAHERVVTTLKKMGVAPDETFFMDGIEKLRVLRVFKPHIFFDDQLTHLTFAAGSIPSVHVPFGIRNSSV